MLNTLSPGHDPVLSERKKARLSDICYDALTLAGLLHILDNYSPTDMRGRGAAVSLLAVAEPLAWKIAGDLEGHV